MALQAPLFRGDAKLEAAATSNASHITMGAAGAHVVKIQTALNILDGAGLALSGHYDRETANAVLNYKKIRGIINRAYQSKPDNVVGIMTIKRLDSDLCSYGYCVVTIGTLTNSGPILRSKLQYHFSDTVSNSTTPYIVGLRAIIRGNPYRQAGASAADGMPPSIPPKKSCLVRVSVDPPLSNPDDFIELSVANASPLHGSATVAPPRITSTTLVLVSGGAQTKPGFAARLSLLAKLNGTELKASSEGFSVCAHPSSVHESYYDDIDSGQVGMRVKVECRSDTGNVLDLDEVRWSELIEHFKRDEPPFSQGSGMFNNSGYMRCPMPGDIAVDRHAEPRPSAGLSGKVEKLQLHIFKCNRCGAFDKVIPNSGYEITDTVFEQGGRWKHRVKKEGKSIGMKLRPPSSGFVRAGPGLGGSVSNDHDL